MTGSAHAPALQGSGARAERDAWVELHLTALQSGQRAPQVPADTAAVPLEMRVKGYLLSPACVGEMAEILTPAGRRIVGTLSAVNPPYVHTFGEPVPALATIGRELRAMLANCEHAGNGG